MSSSKKSVFCTQTSVCSSFRGRTHKQGLLVQVWKKGRKCTCDFALSRSQWPRGLRRSSAAARLLRLWVRIPPGVWKFVCCECCVLSGRGLCDGLITRPEESYRLWCVVVCDLETSKHQEALTHWGAVAPKIKKKKLYIEAFLPPQW